MNYACCFEAGEESSQPGQPKPSRTHGGESLAKGQRHEFFSTQTADDIQNFRWTIRFLHFDFSLVRGEHREAGVIVCVEIDEESVGVQSCHDASVWCAVVGMIVFSRDGQRTLCLDFGHVFSARDKQVMLVAYWSSILGPSKHTSQPVEVLADIRALQQRTPYH